MRSSIGTWTLSSGRWWVTRFWQKKKPWKSCFYRSTTALFFSPQTDLVKSTSRTLYGLKSNVDYEVRVRCKTLGGKAFGEFSDSVFVHIPSKGEGSLLSWICSFITCLSASYTWSDFKDRVMDAVSICISLHSVTFSSLGLANIWSFVCCGHPDAGGHFTAGKVCIFNYSSMCFK